MAELPESLAVVGSGARGIIGDPLDAAFPARALFEALHRWVAAGELPPPSRIPMIARGQLVPRESVRFPTIGGVQAPARPFVPRRLDFGARWGEGLIDNHPPVPGLPFTVLLPQLDSIGNEVGGVPTVETLVPVGTYTGWRLGPWSLGWEWIVPYSGMFVPLPRTEAQRASTGDNRPSLELLCADTAAYHQRITVAMEQLVRDRFLLARDTAAVRARADTLWHLVLGASADR